MLDIIVIARNRVNMLRQCVDAVVSSTKDFRLTIIDDYTDSEELWVYLPELRSKCHQLILNGSNMGSTPSMDTGLQMAKMWQWFHDEPNNGYTLFIEDDIVLHKDWQDVCYGLMNEFEEKYHVAFIGWDSPEHTVLDSAFFSNGHRVKVKNIIRSSMMFGRNFTWTRLGLVPRRNPNGTERGKPHNGLGSRRELYYLFDSPTCLASTGHKVLAVCDICDHLGENISTWRV